MSLFAEFGIYLRKILIFPKFGEIYHTTQSETSVLEHCKINSSTKIKSFCFFIS